MTDARFRNDCRVVPPDCRVVPPDCRVVPPARRVVPPARRVVPPARRVVTPDRRVATLRRCAAPLVTLLAVLVGLNAGGFAPVAAPTAGSVSVAWEGVGLRSVCARLSTLVGRPVILDPRVDPDIPVTLELRDAPLEDALGRLCAATGTGCAVLPSTIRVVPAGTADGVVAEEARRRAAVLALPPDLRAAARATEAWVWNDGATPSTLASAAAEAAGITLDGVDRLRHDHLAAADLPPLPLAERLDLVVGPLGSRVDWAAARRRDGGLHVPLAALETPPRTDRAGPAVVAAAGAWNAVPPPRRPGPRPGGGTTWSLEVAAPLDRLLATVAARLDLELQLDSSGLERVGVAAGEIVRLSVKDVERDELLDRIVEPLGLRWSIEGRQLRVGPPDER